MPDYIILKLQGPMQAWGGHTFEDRRPSHDFPTRSGLVGLLAACLGLERDDHAGLEALDRSVVFAVRGDQRTLAWEEFGQTRSRRIEPAKLIDYHTIREARRANRAPKEGETVQSWREYLHDCVFTVALGVTAQATVNLADIEAALNRPAYTPFLGRRSCPISRPLMAGRVQAETLFEALAGVEPHAGLVYSEEDLGDAPQIMIRDVPLRWKHRQFATRRVNFKPQGETP